MDSGRRSSPAAVIVNWHAAFSAGDIDAALDQHAGDVEVVDLGAERLVRGLGEVAIWMTAWRVAFPDARLEHLDLEVIDPTLSASSSTLIGTHEGPLGGIGPTGCLVRLPVTAIHHFTGRALLTRHFVNYDPRVLFDQLGVPVPPSFGTAAVTTPPR